MNSTFSSLFKSLVAASTKDSYTVPHFINGELYKGEGKIVGDIYNPALGNIQAKVNFATPSEVEKAVAAASQAFPVWSQTPPLKRARIFFKFKNLLEQHINDIAAIVTREHGKTLEDAKGSIERGIELVEYACSTPQLLSGNYSPEVGKGVDCYTIRQPLGVCVGVSPFNFPVMVPIWLFGFALTCGNTFVLKPSEKDPTATLLLASLLSEAGLPPGVLNIVNGDKDTVDILLKHPAVQAVSAIGSTHAARHIYQTAILNGKRAHTFGGAKNHCVVLPDADIETTGNAILSAAYGSAGERCMALSVVLCVGDKVADKLVSYLASKVSLLKIGSGADNEIEMGPLVSKEHRQKVQSYIESGVSEGAELVVDGRSYQNRDYPAGFFLAGTLFDRVTPQMKIYQEEIFGPVLGVVRVHDYDTALELINSHPYGNGVAIFTKNGGAAHHFATHVQVGMVGINVPIPVPIAYHNFGGWKESFFGDLALHGDQSVQFYTRSKSITVRWPTSVELSYIMPMHD